MLYMYYNVHIVICWRCQRCQNTSVYKKVVVIRITMYMLSYVEDVEGVKNVKKILTM